MLITNTSQHFGVVSKLFHWSIALLIIGLICLGWYMVELTYYDRWYNDSLNVHKSLGMIVLGLAGAKLIWNWYTPSPPLASTVPAWEQAMARASHAALLAVMFVLPVTGYVISTSEGAAVGVFNWFEIPAVFVAEELLRDFAIDVHFYTSYATAALVVVHTGAALKHQFIERDGTLRRMC